MISHTHRLAMWLRCQSSVFSGLVLLAFRLNAAESPALEIYSDNGGEFDLERGTAHYVGNVRIIDPSGLNLRCEDLIADLPVGNNRFNEVVATRNVVIEVVQPAKQSGGEPLKITATGDRAVYTATNSVLTLSGNPAEIRLPQGTFTSESPIEYNRKTGSLRTKGKWKTVLNPSSLKAGGLFGPEASQEKK